MKTNQPANFDFAPLTVGTMRLGRWGSGMDAAGLQAFVEGCLAMGLCDFDHADIYGDYTTEADFGSVLKAAPHLRDQMKLITKCGIRLVSANRPSHAIKSYDAGKAHIIQSVDHSLAGLQTDHIDLLLIHRPDYLLDPHEVAEAFDALRTAGKVLAFGVSNFTTTQFAMLQQAVPLATNQIEVSLLQRQAFDDGTLDQCLTAGIRPMAWSPYGGGAVFDPAQEGAAARVRAAAQTLANAYKATLDQVLLAWLLRHPAGIVPVLGTSKLARLRQAKEALSISMTREEWYTLWQAATGHEVA